MWILPTAVAPRLPKNKKKQVQPDLQKARQMYKLQLCFYTLVNEQPKNEIKKARASKRIKYFRINLTKKYKMYTLKTVKHC